jgi:hypothetical protein
MTCPPWLGTVNIIQQSSVTGLVTAGQTLYFRTVAVHRMKTVAAGPSDNIGSVGYSGAEQGTVSVEGETILFIGLPATIQLGAVGRTTKSGELPADAVSKPIWNILIPATAISIYSIRDRDIIIDDEGYRYEVAANYWTAAGYQLSTVREEA